MQESLFNIDELKHKVEYALSSAKRLGISAAEVSVNTANGFSVNVRLGEIDTLEYHYGKELSITVYLGQKTASVTTTDFSDKAIDLAVEKARKMVSYIDDDPYAGLADASFLAYEYPDLDLYHPWSLDIKDAISLVQKCEKLGLAHDKRITNSEGAALSTGEFWHIYGNSLGFLGFYPTTHHSLSLSLIAGQGSTMQRDYSYTVARDANDLESFEHVAKEAAERTVRRLGAKTLATKSCPVVFEADMAKSLLGSFLSALNGYNLYRKSSFLLDHVGQKIFAPHIEIHERPLLPKALGSVPFDAEGVRTKNRELVVNGVLQGYVLDSYSGRRLNMPTTGNAGGVHNLFIDAGEKDLSGLLKMMQSGFLVTELLGSDANIVTGDYSRAAFGYWVEKGEIQYPVMGITVASNLKDMFLKMRAVGNDIDHRGSIHTGSILIDEMMLAGS